MSTSTPAATMPRPARHDGRRQLAIPDRVVSAAPLGGLLLLTAVLYLWGLSKNGYANEYYSAAVQAGTHSWKAVLFGSLDAGNYITVDKPPASLWAMEISTRLFGFSSLSMLLPQALEGVAAVALLYATVRRWFGRPAAMLSGLVLAITPVAALMFRFNNPDAMLVLLLVAGAYCVTRAVERGQTKWLALAGTALGFAFLTKMMQAFIVLPAFALVYLVAAPVPLRRRLWQLVLAGAAMVAAAGWWVALVELWPASARPYIGGSTDNSVLELVFGYNGLGRISGGNGPGGGGGAGFSGVAGILRLFNSELGGQISWLLPASVIALGAGIVSVVLRRPARTDRVLATVLLWGCWLVVTAAVYSFMSGTIHPYYANTLAPAIAVLAGVGATLLWQQRERLIARLTLGGILAATGVWAFALLDRTASWHPWLRTAILIGSLVATVLVVLRAGVLGRRARASLAAAAVVIALAAPAAFTLDAVASVQTGSNPSAGPTVALRGGFGGGSLPGSGSMPGSGPAAHSGSMPARPSGGSAPNSRSMPSSARAGSGNAVSSSAAAALAVNASRYKWIVATSSAQTAAGIQLATGKSVMAIGGFTGSDNAITLARFEQLVAQGKIHYYVGGGSGGPGGSSGPGGGGVTQTIQSWVAKHFKSTTVGGMTVYDLTHRTA